MHEYDSFIDSVVRKMEWKKRNFILFLNKFDRELSDGKYDNEIKWKCGISNKRKFWTVGFTILKYITV